MAMLSTRFEFFFRHFFSNNKNNSVRQANFELFDGALHLPWISDFECSCLTFIKLLQKKER